MRFDEKTRGLNAFLFAFMTVFSSGISMYAMARLIQALHLLDTPFTRMGLAAKPDFSRFHRTFGVDCARLYFSWRINQRNL